MKFFNRLFTNIENDPSTLLRNASGNKPNLDFELRLLDECKRKREIFINTLASLKIEDIDKTIATYEDHITAFFSRGKVIICRIIVEKLTQLRKAREIIQKGIRPPTLATTSLQRF